MNKELIEYHRGRAKFYEDLAKTFPSDSSECLKANGRMLMHERAVKWLEGPRHPDLPAVWDGDAWVSPITDIIPQ